MTAVVNPGAPLSRLSSRNLRVTMHTILLVDDDEADAYLFRRALEDVAAQSGVCVNLTHLTHGREGCEALKRGGRFTELPDTIVVDLNMPVMNGIAFVRWLRSQPDLKSLHTAVWTTSTESTIHAAALDAGADRVFVKPNTLRAMAAIASEILARPNVLANALPA
jgi:CheY-like chemotaxis protein